MTILTNKKSIALVAGAAMTAGLALSPTLASADTENPFASTELSSGYLQLAEGKCGEAKCGADKKAKKEGKCGEAKCGADKKASKEGKCGEAKCGANKKAEGKCGEAKCGAAKVDKTFLSSNPSYSAAMDK